MKVLVFFDYFSRAGIAVFLICDIAFKGLISRNWQLGGMIFFLFSFFLVKVLLYKKKKTGDIYIIIVLIGLLCFNGGIAHHFLRAYDRKLDSLYRVLIKDPESVEKQQEFLDYFPDNFPDFQKTYGYNPKYSKNDPMYDAGHEHIFKGLARLNKLSDTIYYARLINLSIGGKWEADAVSALQDLVQKKTEDKPLLLFNLLVRYPREKIYSFWYFYFNSLHPLKGGIPAFLLQMQSEYPIVFQEMQKAFRASDGQAIGG